MKINTDKRITNKINANKPNVIVTIPPYASFIREVAAHPVVSGLRLNTVMPVKESLEEVLDRLHSEVKHLDKKLWIDLKCRQLRVKGYWVPPFTEVEVSHDIKVNTPTKAYFSDGKEVATLVRVDGNKLIMLEGPKRVIGPGESVNIPDNSLKIDGYFTDVCKDYINAAKKIGIHDYMISFVEHTEDVKTMYELDPDANIVEKIESLKGLDYVNHYWNKGDDVVSGKSRLMAARGDLFVELRMPHHNIKATEDIIKKDPNAIVASRLLSSLTYSLEPSCADINEIDNLLRMGYRTFMLGDDICMDRDSVISALNVFYAISKSY